MRQESAKNATSARPRWAQVLRALRESRGVTQDGWAAWLGVSRRAIQRWERGEAAPDAVNEAAIVAFCREKGLFRTFGTGPLRGPAITPESLSDLLAEARLREGGRARAGLRPAPPPASPAVSNLPAPITGFIGREREMAQVRRLLAVARLLTLTGAGGCGKTRLALEVAGEVQWAYPDGVWLVELAALMDPALVPQAAAAAVGVRRSAGRPPTETLVEALKPRQVLLVLDNCEHLALACAGLAERLLRGCPHVQILATSRQALGVVGETVWRVPPMTVPSSEFRVPSQPQPRSERGTRNAEREQPDAVRLFVERARAVRPEFELLGENVAAVAEICRRLDGIPLAIELAAARVRVLAVEQIATRLDDRFRLLTEGSTTALPRHQTLRAAMDWSYDLLSEAEQAALRRLSVFAGGWSLEAAEIVAGLRVEDSVLDLLTSLVDRSLVIAEHRGSVVRHGMLETVRQYAGEKLAEAGEVGAVRDRHLAWCLTLAEAADAELRGPCEPAWFARLEEEHDNLRTALAWSLARSKEEAEAGLRLAGSLARFWELRGYLREGQGWLSQVLTAGNGAPAGLRAKALHGAGRLAYEQGDYTAARGLHERSLVLSEELGDRQGIAEAQHELGMVALRRGDHAAAGAFLDASLALYVELGCKPGIAGALGALGFLALRQGDHGTARARLEAGLTLHRELGDKDGIAEALDDLATVAGEQGEVERQAVVLEECLALYRELGNKGGVARVLGDLGVGEWMQGEYERAAALLEESLALYREVNERRGIARVLGNQGLVALHQRDYGRADVLCRESLRLYREDGDAWGIGRYLPVLAGAAFGQGQTERAALLFGAAASLRERLGTPLPPVVWSTHDRTIAAIREALGDKAFEAAWARGQAMSAEAAAAAYNGDDRAED